MQNPADAAAEAATADSGTDTDSGAGVAIEARAVSKVFGHGDGQVRALDAATLTIRRNEFFTLLGPSGCGKTTLLRLIAGFDHPSAGALLLGGEDISLLPPYRRPVNTVFQSYALFPHLSVADNVAFGLQMLDRPRDVVADTVADMLRLVRLEALRDRRPAELSGGQQQRVALARALAPRPQVLLLDEPLSALDLKLRKEMQIELKRLQHETGITFVFVTHDQEEALTMSDRIAVMSAGRILQVGSPREIYDHPADRFVADFIGDSNLLTAEVLARQDGGAGGDMLRLRLGGALEVEARCPDGLDPAPGDRLSVALRPEHLRLVDDGATTAGVLRGTLANAVYFGTDTHFHVSLAHGETLVVRMQNLRDQRPVAAAGDRVGVALRGSALQVLRD